MRDETTDQDVNYEWAKAELQKAAGRDERAGSTRGDDDAQQLAEYRTLARQLGEDAIAQDDLASSEKAAEENYLLYVKKREEARMGDALDEGGIVNVAIAEQPVVPALPVLAARSGHAGGLRRGADFWDWGGIRGGLSGSGAAHAGGSVERVWKFRYWLRYRKRRDQAVIRLREMR